MNKFLLPCFITLLTFCSSLAAQNIISEEILFTDSDTVLLTTNKRGFYANKMVDAHVNYPYATGTDPESVGDGVYRVLNVVPAEFSDLYVYAKLSGVEDTILVDKFDLIKAYTSTIVELPFVTGEKEFQTYQGDTVIVTDSKNKIDSMWTACDDSVFQKISSIKQTTYYKFTQNSLTNANWGELTPTVARHFTTSTANIMYMWSQPFVEELVSEYSGVLYNNQARFVCLNLVDSLIKVNTWSSTNKFIELTDELFEFDSTLYVNFYKYEKVEKLNIKGTTDSLLSIYPNAVSVDKFYTIADTIDPKVDLLDKILSHKKINFCPTGAVSGLGGGWSFGVNGSHFTNARYEKAKTAPTPFTAAEGGLSTWAHEWAHCIGFSHSSNTTYGGIEGSWVDITCVAFEILSTDNNEVPGVMYEDSVPRIVTETLPFLYNIYIQEIDYTDSIKLGDIDYEMYSTTSIQLENNNYNADADLVIDEIICPEGLSYNGSYPITIPSTASATIPLAISIRNQADTVLHYNEVIVVKGQNTLTIPVTATVTPGLPTELADNKELVEVSVFPNPSTGVVSISSDYDGVQVYDMSGNGVYAQSVYTSSIDLSTLPNGVYFINIIKNGESYMKKIVIE